MGKQKNNQSDAMKTDDGKIHSDVACTVCGCVCDDLTIAVQNGRAIPQSGACSMAEPWFAELSPFHGDAALIDGKPQSVEKSIEKAAGFLRNAVSPLIYGLSRSSTPGQQAAVELADRLGANIDTTASTCHAPSIMALQSSGESCSTLGEVRNRSDLIIYWGSNPAVSHPRHIERFVDAPGLFVPEGRAGRHVVVIDVERTETADLADTFLQVNRGQDLELIWTLRALLAGENPEGESFGGILRADVVDLAERLQATSYGALFFGLGLTRNALPHNNVEALLRLATDVQRHTRCVVRRMRIPGDVAGADSVLCWQTGFPFSVNFHRGFPRYNPGEFTANDLLERGEVDAFLTVGSEGIEKFSPQAQAFLQTIPMIALDYPLQICPISPNVQFTTAIYGVHRPGTAYRMDEVPIPLRQFSECKLPSDDEVLAAILAAL